MSDGSYTVCSLGRPARPFVSYKIHRWAQFVLSFRLIRVLASFRWLPSSSFLFHRFVHQVRWFRVIVVIRAAVLLVLSLFVVFFVGPIFVLSATLVLVMADNVDEITPAAVTSSSPQATASVPVVESADESMMTPSNPTMAALLGIVRARSSASVAPPPVPVATPSGCESFTGVVRRASNVATNDPADVIGSHASSLDRLMKSVLQRGGCAECARVSFSWDAISGCQRSEIVRLREIAESVGTCATVHTGRHLDLVEGSFTVPSSIRCDRLFLIAAAEAKYVAFVESYLFEGDVAYPGLGDRSLRDVVFRSGCVRPWKTSYSLMNGSHVCISYRDFLTLRGKLAHAYDVMMAGRLQNRTLLMLPFSRFPPLPDEVVGALPPQGLSVHLPRVALYFANCVQSARESVRLSYEVAFLLEWAHIIAAALKLETETNARVWKCSAECIDFLERFSSLDDFFVEAVNRFVVSVSFRVVRVVSFVGREAPSGSRVHRCRVDDSTRLSVGLHRCLGRDRSERWFRCSPGHVDSRDAACVSSCSARSSASRYVIVATVTLVDRNRDPRRSYPYGTDVGPVFASEAVRVSRWRVRD